MTDRNDDIPGAPPAIDPSVGMSALRSMVDMFPDLIMIMAGDGVVIAANQVLARSLGTTVEQLIGRRVFDFMSKEAAERRQAWATEVISSGETKRKIDRHRDRVFDTVGYPVTSDNGEVTGVAIVSRDITEQTRAEEKVRERQARQAQSDKMEAVGTLAAGIAHDFNNLLTSIMANAQLAARTSMDDAKRAQLLAAITTASVRGANLVRQILAHGGDDDSLRELDLCEVVHEVVSLMRSTLPANIEFEATLPDEPLWVVGNVARLHRTVMNLCVNAGQSMPGGGTVTVDIDAVTLTSAADVAPGPYARLRIRDVGCGMSPDVVARMFEPFYSTKEPERGSGLGLFVVHGVVQSLRGTIAVDSEPGKGTLFTIHLPQLDRAAIQAARPPAIEAPKIEGRRVLILDDEPAIRQVAVMTLQGVGHAVEVTSRCADARATFERDPSAFDVAILDQRLRDGTGLELALMMRKRRPDMVVVLCSGHVTSEMRRECRANDIDVLHKPYDLSQLIGAAAGTSSK